MKAGEAFFGLRERATPDGSEASDERIGGSLLEQIAQALTCLRVSS